MSNAYNLITSAILILDKITSVLVKEKRRVGKKMKANISPKAYELEVKQNHSSKFNI